MVSDAGASARARYNRDREWAAGRAQARRALRRAGIALFPLIVAGSLGAAGLDPGRVRPVAGVGLAVGLAVVVGRWRDRRAGQRGQAWRVGAEGEEATAAALATLERRGFVALHDVAAPGVAGNIDHVVIGPTGVVALETKRWSGHVRVGLWALGHDGRRRPEVLEQARRAAAAVAAAVGAPVRPVVCIHGAVRAGGLRLLWCRRFRQGRVGGVLVVSGGEALARALRRAPRRLSRRQVAALAAAASSSLAPQAAVSRGPRRRGS